MGQIANMLAARVLKAHGYQVEPQKQGVPTLVGGRSAMSSHRSRDRTDLSAVSHQRVRPCVVCAHSVNVLGLLTRTALFCTLSRRPYALA
jgi:hypothetical protein